jgi:triosephosphate isomerase
MICIANWKLKIETKSEVDQLLNDYNEKQYKNNCKVVVCPSFTQLSVVGSSLPNTWFLGAQSVSRETKGSHTGEVSAAQIKASGCKYCIVGHSEERKKGETFLIVAEKITMLQKENLIPVVCFGESALEREGDYLATIKSQLIEATSKIEKKGSEIIFAYEPIWAIGKEAARPSTPVECKEVVEFVREFLSENGFSVFFVLYGGSVSAENVGGYVADGGADGFLLGRASLSGEDFSAIINAAK